MRHVGDYQHSSFIQMLRREERKKVWKLHFHFIAMLAIRRSCVIASSYRCFSHSLTASSRARYLDVA